MITMAEMLDRVQQATGAPFPMPLAWSSTEALHLMHCDQLLREHWTPQPFPDQVLPVQGAALRDLLAGGPLPRISFTMSSKGTLPTTQLMGHTITMPAHMLIQASNVLITNPAQLHAFLATQPPSAHLPVQLHADLRTTCTAHLVDDAGSTGDA
jgi:hypothetical protein